MTGFFARYTHGECRQVWQEMLELGEHIREKPVYQDALDVARETMSRVRHNVELLIPRLLDAGYRFGYDALSVDPVFSKRQPHPLLEPGPDIHDMLSRFEREIGTLPLSLYAWYENVGEVNFVGMVPPGWKSSQLDMPTLERYSGDEPWMFSEETIRFYDEHPDLLEHTMTWLDPLQVIPLIDQFELYEDWRPGVDDSFTDADDSPLRESEDAALTNMSDAFRVEISPDAALKFDQSGLGAYEIAVPNSCADALVINEWHHLNFVDYLRACLKWGGLPGFELYKEAPIELALVTADLRPF